MQQARPLAGIVKLAGHDLQKVAEILNILQGLVQKKRIVRLFILLDYTCRPAPKSLISLWDRARCRRLEEALRCGERDQRRQHHHDRYRWIADSAASCKLSRLYWIKSLIIQRLKD